MYFKKKDENVNKFTKNCAMRITFKVGAAVILSTSLLWNNTINLHDDTTPMKIVYAANSNTQAKIQSEKNDTIACSAIFESSESITENAGKDLLEKHIASKTTGFEQTLENVEERSDFTYATEITTESSPCKESQKRNLSDYVKSYAQSISTGVLNAYHGTTNGPSGKETYYNLPMDRVIWIMRNMGYSEEEYPYWVRDDGVKMFGPYVMVAASLDIRPKGTIIECSKGTAIVVDTGDFAKTNRMQLDIATLW
jgi:hypothetical protein